MLHGERRANNGRAFGSNGQESGDGVSDQIDEFVATIEFEKLISIPSYLPSPAVSPHASGLASHPLSGNYQPTTSSVSTSGTLKNAEMIVEQGADCETPALFHSPSTSASKPLLPKSLFPAQRVDGRMLIQGGAKSPKKNKKEEKEKEEKGREVEKEKGREIEEKGRGSEKGNSTLPMSTSSSTCTAIPCTSLLLDTIRKRANQIEKNVSTASYLHTCFCSMLLIRALCWRSRLAVTAVLKLQRALDEFNATY